MAKKFNPYRAWANDYKVMRQWTAPVKPICTGCGKAVNTCMELYRNGKCETCFSTVTVTAQEVIAVAEQAHTS